MSRYIFYKSTGREKGTWRRTSVRGVILICPECGSEIKVDDKLGFQISQFKDHIRYVFPRVQCGSCFYDQAVELYPDWTESEYNFRVKHELGTYVCGRAAERWLELERKRAVDHDRERIITYFRLLIQDNDALLKAVIDVIQQRPR